jgi:hypothetical protein
MSLTNETTWQDRLKSALAAAGDAGAAVMRIEIDACGNIALETRLRGKKRGSVRRPKLPRYATYQIDRHGHPRCYFVPPKGTGKRVTLPLPSSPAFLGAYQRAFADYSAGRPCES